MKPKTMILMILAVGCGLAASYLTSRLLAERSNAAPAEEEKVAVLVARQKIPIGALVKEPDKLFVEKLFIKGEEPKKAIKTFDQIKDHRLNKPLAEEQFVTADDLMDPKQSGLETLLPAGMRAIALKVSADSTAGGFVLPNSHVDVVSTVRRGDKDTYSQIILQNMLVLAADMQYHRDAEKQSMIASTVTVAAKPEDAQKLRLAGAMGELSLLLRSPEDDAIVHVKAATPTDVAKGASRSSSPGSGEEDDLGGAPGGVWGKVPDVPAPAAVAEKRESAPPPKPKSITQIIYNGESVTKAVFVLDNGAETTTQIEKTSPEPSARKDKSSAETANSKDKSSAETANGKAEKSSPEQSDAAPRKEAPAPAPQRAGQ